MKWEKTQLKVIKEKLSYLPTADYALQAEDSVPVHQAAYAKRM